MTRFTKPTRIFIGVTLAVLLCDLLTKELALYLFSTSSAPAWNGPVGLGFSLALNYGAAGGLDLGDYTRAINIFSMALVGTLAILCVRSLSTIHRWAPAALGLITGAAAGNVLSLVVRPAVVDFISLSSGGMSIAFNIADVAVAVGIMSLAPICVELYSRARAERTVHGPPAVRTGVPVFKRSTFEREVPIAIAMEVAIEPEVREKLERERQRERVIGDLPADIDIRDELR